MYCRFVGHCQNGRDQYISSCSAKVTCAATLKCGGLTTLVLPQFLRNITMRKKFSGVQV